MAEKMEITFTRYVDDPTDPEYDPETDVEVEETVPGKYAVCGRCQGKGSHTHPSVDGPGLSREDFDEDPQFEEDYFAGVYDVACYECNGARVVLVVDEDLAKRDPIVWGHYQKHLATEAANAREMRFEQRMRDMSGGEW